MNLFSRKPAASQATASAPCENTAPAIDENAVISFLQALGDGRYDASVNVDGPLGSALGSLAAKLQGRAGADLDRTVGFSSQASESMVDVAWVVDDIKMVGDDAQTMAAAVEQMAASINQVAEASAETSSAAQTAQDSAHASTDQIARTTEAMRDISQLVGTLSSRLEVLEEAASQIEGMAQTIEDISDQTKLLALNATIEAARAGDAGKGFAVVASEVKSLSEQTSKATDNIRERIATLNGEMREMKGAMSSSYEAVSRGETMVGEIGGQIGHIVERVSSATMQMGEIATVLEEQRNATAEIAGRVNNIASRAATTRDNIDHMAGSVSNIEELIGKQFAALDGMDIPNFILHRAKSDHLIWKKKLAELLAGLTSINQSELSDHHTCRLGKWYDGVTEQSLVSSGQFRELLVPHEKVHKHGKLVAQYHGEGRVEEAKQEFALMEKASVEVINILDSLIRISGS